MIGRKNIPEICQNCDRNPYVWSIGTPKNILDTEKGAVFLFTGGEEYGFYGKSIAQYIPDDGSTYKCDIVGFVTDEKSEKLDLELFNSKIPATLNLKTGMLSSPEMNTEIYIDNFMNLVEKRNKIAASYFASLN